LNIIASFRVALSAVALVAASAGAQDFPSRPISIVVPFASGGPTDTSARIVSAAMARETGAAFVVENVPGAGATVGATKVAQAKPDGHTLLWGSGSSLAMTPHLYTTLKYDPIKSFAPVGLVVAQPFVLVAKPSLNVKSVRELVALAKAQPGKLNFSSTGQGASSHLVAELFKKESGVFATHVPYNGGAPATNALLSGDVDFYFDTPTTLVPLIKTGKLVALAVTSKKRWDDLPDVPSLNELGFTNFDATTWFGLVAPAGTPPERIAYLSKHLTNALAQPQVTSALKAAGFAVEPSAPDEFARKIASETARWGVTIRAAKIKLD
jgi:tripartite-type tricarboxylate transporter receptor subunit TctC